MTDSVEMKKSRHLTFNLGSEVFAVDVSRVREILHMPRITTVPGTPGFMRGVINVRGSVVPVIDLRRKFGMPEPEHEVCNRIIVMEPLVDEEAAVFGALADSVSDVIELESVHMDTPRAIGSRWRGEFVTGIGQSNGRFILLLDIDAVFSLDDPPAAGTE